MWFCIYNTPVHTTTLARDHALIELEYMDQALSILTGCLITHGIVLLRFLMSKFVGKTSPETKRLTKQRSYCAGAATCHHYTYILTTLLTLVLAHNVQIDFFDRQTAVQDETHCVCGE